LTFTGTFGKQSSRYIDIPERSFSLWNYGILKYKEFFMLFAFIGGICGIILGIIICDISSKKEKEKIYETKTISSINNYYKNQKNHSFSEEQMPRSIEDYYKKSK
jgi:hypothetical protein